MASRPRCAAPDEVPGPGCRARGVRCPSGPPGLFFSKHDFDIIIVIRIEVATAQEIVPHHAQNFCQNIDFVWVAMRLLRSTGLLPFGSDHHVHVHVDVHVCVCMCVCVRVWVGVWVCGLVGA